MAERKYPELNPWELEPDYSQHVATMTEEGLDSKGAIAEQLAWRDRKLAAALAKVAELEAVVRKLELPPRPDDGDDGGCRGEEGL